LKGLYFTKLKANMRNVMNFNKTIEQSERQAHPTKPKAVVMSKSRSKYRVYENLNPGKKVLEQAVELTSDFLDVAVRKGLIEGHEFKNSQPLTSNKPRVRFDLQPAHSEIRNKNWGLLSTSPIAKKALKENVIVSPKRPLAVFLHMNLVDFFDGSSSGRKNGESVARIEPYIAEGYVTQTPGKAFWKSDLRRKEFTFKREKDISSDNALNKDVLQDYFSALASDLVKLKEEAGLQKEEMEFRLRNNNYCHMTYQDFRQEFDV